MIILNHGKKIEIEVNKKNRQDNLMQLLQDNNIYLSNSCHGNGTCGKCKVRIKNFNLAITEREEKILSKYELEQGIRLACKIRIEDVLKIDAHNEVIVEILETQEESIVVESVDVKGNIDRINKSEAVGRFKRDIYPNKDTYFIAIDIGTTTIAMALVDSLTGDVCETYTSINHQRRYGSDVISRVVAANEGKGQELKQIIEEDLWSGIYYFMNKLDDFENPIDDERRYLSGIVIAGNTTMMHLLMGYSCESLGKAPFISEHLEEKIVSLKECLGYGKRKVPQWIHNVPTILLPGISVFVGSDIFAGLLVCQGFKSEEVSLFLDLGTNGEMVLGNKNRMLSASVAAGPAFEGGNIACGIASVPGSINKVKIKNKKAVVGTINKQMPPLGVCGSGLISLIAQLIREKIINVHGNLCFPFCKDGFPLWIFETGEKIALYQEDVRQFQMAKSAIRSGIEIMMNEYNCQKHEIKYVYLAGGFGNALSKEDVVVTGMLPEEWLEKIEMVGNTALLGAIESGKLMFSKNKSESHYGELIKDVLGKMNTISLVNNEEFQRLYIDNMEFNNRK